MRQRKPNRHFVEIPVSFDTWLELRHAAVYVLCGDSPEYWLRERRGELAPANKTQSRQLKRLMGAPKKRAAPEPRKRQNPLKPPTSEPSDTLF